MKNDKNREFEVKESSAYQATKHAEEEHMGDTAYEILPDFGYGKSPGKYTVEDYCSLPEDQRVELIDGCFYEMNAPTWVHQRVVGEIHRQIANYIHENKGSCQSAVAPADVQLDCDEKTMLQPDVMIICHDERIEKWGLYGAPDFVLEVVSPSTKRRDYILKAQKYMNAGVREYWILDPDKKSLLVYLFEEDVVPVIYGLSGEIPIHIYDGDLKIQLEEIGQWCNS